MSKLCSKKPIIAITMGDPNGIGAEVIVKSLMDRSLLRKCYPVLVGNKTILTKKLFFLNSQLQVTYSKNFHRSFLATSDLTILDPELDHELGITLGSSILDSALHNELDTEYNNKENNTIQTVNRSVDGIQEQSQSSIPKISGIEKSIDELKYIRTAVSGCINKTFDAMVTAPINKEALYKKGFNYIGHTEYIAYLCGVENPVMGFFAPKLRVSLVTVHIPLQKLFKALSKDKILQTIISTADSMKSFFGYNEPRIAVAGLNPHAGESGYFGTEEKKIIIPAVEKARSLGLNVVGPISPDTVFARAIKGHFDWVIALYHDQGLIPVKVLSFGESVNITLGIPIIRTSVDHGVAYDIVDKNIADPSSMKSAIQLALDIIHNNKII